LSTATSKYKKLQKKWYDKLKKEGFEDIEQDEDHLKQWDSQLFITRHTNFTSKSGKKEAHFDATWFKSQEEYYQLAGAFLHEHEFDSKVDKVIWELHSEGMPNTEIYKELVKRKSKVYQEGIRKTISKLAKVMVEKACQPPKKT
jgi:hypothetical protein